jgi:hypothetical protein
MQLIAATRKAADVQRKLILRRLGCLPWQSKGSRLCTFSVENIGKLDCLKLVGV